MSMGYEIQKNTESTQSELFKTKQKSIWLIYEIIFDSTHIWYVCAENIIEKNVYIQFSSHFVTRVHLVHVHLDFEYSSACSAEFSQNV